jgi:hypothetical protein
MRIEDVGIGKMGESGSEGLDVPGHDPDIIKRVAEVRRDIVGRMKYKRVGHDQGKRGQNENDQDIVSAFFKKLSHPSLGCL